MYLLQVLISCPTLNPSRPFHIARVFIDGRALVDISAINRLVAQWADALRFRALAPWPQENVVMFTHWQAPFRQ